MRLVILGAGAIGGVVGGLLARANREVLLLARGAHLAAIRERGLRVESPGETFVVHPPVAERVADWRPGDLVVLATKTQDAAAALRGLAAPPEIPIACFTNGVEAERIALRHARSVYGACVMMPATYLQPGIVQVWAAPVPGLIDVGRYPDGQGEHVDELAGELIVAGFSVETRTNIMKWKRGKLLSNLANGAEALCGPAARTSAIADRARAEARACFAAANLSCSTEAEDAARRAGYASKPIEGATRSGGSTWQSLARGATTLETDYLNGEIALLGRLNNVPTPVNEALQRIAAEAAAAGHAPGSMSLDELAARVSRYERVEQAPQ
jgi:2-dehydropantoate 2-reductase